MEHALLKRILATANAQLSTVNARLEEKVRLCMSPLLAVMAIQSVRVYDDPEKWSREIEQVLISEGGVDGEKEASE